MKRFLIVLALLVFIVLNSVSAQNVSFSTLGQLAPQQVLVYGYNATSSMQELISSGNTTGDGIPIPANGDFNIVIKPDNSAVASNPETMMAAFWDYIMKYWIPIALAAFIMSILILGRK